jgi:hypothetical protein
MGVDWPMALGDPSEQFYSRTAIGAIVRGLAAAWGCDAGAIWDASCFETDKKRFERPVGSKGAGTGKEIVVNDVQILRRPKS